MLSATTIAWKLPGRSKPPLSGSAAGRSAGFLKKEKDKNINVIEKPANKNTVLRSFPEGYLDAVFTCRWFMNAILNSSHVDFLSIFRAHKSSKKPRRSFRHIDLKINISIHSLFIFHFTRRGCYFEVYNKFVIQIGLVP